MFIGTLSEFVLKVSQFCRLGVKLFLSIFPTFLSEFHSKNKVHTFGSNFIMTMDISECAAGSQTQTTRGHINDAYAWARKAGAGVASIHPCPFLCMQRKLERSACACGQCICVHVVHESVCCVKASMCGMNASMVRHGALAWTRMCM